MGSGRGGNRNFVGRIFCYDSLSVYHTPFSIISIFTRHTALCLFAVAIMGTCLWGVSLWKFSHTLNLFVMPLVGGAVYATVLGFAKEPLLLDVCRMVKQRIRIK